MTENTPILVSWSDWKIQSMELDKKLYYIVLENGSYQAIAVDHNSVYMTDVSDANLADFIKNYLPMAAELKNINEVVSKDKSLNAIPRTALPDSRPFSGNISNTPLGYLSATGAPVLVRDDFGLTIANSANTQSVNAKMSSNALLFTGTTNNPVIHLDVPNTGTNEVALLSCAHNAIDFFRVMARGTFPPALRFFDQGTLELYQGTAVSPGAVFSLYPGAGPTTYMQTTGQNIAMISSGFINIEAQTDHIDLQVQAANQEIWLSGTIDAAIRLTPDTGVLNFTQTDAQIKLKDSAGANKLKILDSTSTNIFSIDSLGKATFTANPDFSEKQALNFRVQNIVTPAAGNAGRLILDGTAFKYDDGTAFQTLTFGGGSGSISSLTAGRIPFAATATTLSDNANLAWDNTAKRLNLGGTNPSSLYLVSGTVPTSQQALNISSTLAGSSASETNVAITATSGGTGGAGVVKIAVANTLIDGYVGAGSAITQYNFNTVRGSGNNAYLGTADSGPPLGNTVQFNLATGDNSTFSGKYGSYNDVSGGQTNIGVVGKAVRTAAPEHKNLGVVGVAIPGDIAGFGGFFGLNLADSAPAGFAALACDNGSSGQNVFVAKLAGAEAFVVDASGTAVAIMGLKVTALTSGRVPFASTGGLLTDDSDLTFSGDTLTATKLSTTQVTDSGLTANRITYAGTGGLLQDSANLTYDGTTLTAKAATVVTSDAGLLIQSTDLTDGLKIRTLHASTTNATPKTLTFDGGAASPTNIPSIAVSTTHSYIVNVTARDTTNGVSAALITLTALLERTAGGTVTLLQLATENAYKSNVALAATAAADDTNKGLTIQVTGLAATNITWRASVQEMFI